MSDELREALEPFALFALEGKKGGRFIIAKGLFEDMKGWDESPPRSAHLHEDDFRRARALYEALASTPAYSPPNAVKVQRVERVPITHPFPDDEGRTEADPIWRIEIDGFCADFEAELAANNFAAAINRRIASSPPLITEEMVERAAKAMRREDHKYCCSDAALDDLDALPLSPGLIATVRAGLTAALALPEEGKKDV